MSRPKGSKNTANGLSHLVLSSEETVLLNEARDLINKEVGIYPSKSAAAAYIIRKWVEQQRVSEPPVMRLEYLR